MCTKKYNLIVRFYSNVTDSFVIDNFSIFYFSPCCGCCVFCIFYQNHCVCSFHLINCVSALDCHRIYAMCRMCGHQHESRSNHLITIIIIFHRMTVSINCPINWSSIGAYAAGPTNRHHFCFFFLLLFR